MEKASKNKIGQNLKKCPFCGSDKAKVIQDRDRSPTDAYYKGYEYFMVVCCRCESKTKEFCYKYLRDFTPYTVQDFRRNPVLRAKVEDEYSLYLEVVKKNAIDMWNKRAI